ncbi:hypothetical protein ADZ36_05775 [Streptomyces fradiae]|uniref:Uncharacterized protein n=1 Tax=Streptomyces fradiae TaxID=1906 RepID=A0ACC4WFM4_STRFR|nr:hypothetical protein ADZ36_05775 [Streptomyces fradiae]
MPEIPRVPPRSPLTGPRSRLTDAGYRAFANALRAHYEKSGKSIRRLAAETGRAYASVHKVLGDAGTTFRPRGGKHERKR